MSLPGNGIFVVKGEISIILTAMRRGNRWSSHHQDDDQDPLIKAFQELKDLLNTLEDLRLIDPVDYLAPFLKVIRSEDTTGPITSLALSAVNKFLSYGLIGNLSCNYIINYIYYELYCVTMCRSYTFISSADCTQYC